jgi:putative aldouronate transport system permease protein
MCAPGMLWLFFFSIVPMAGILMAFQDYKPKKGIWGSPFIGWENFEYLFSMKDAQNVILNTVIIAFAKIVLNMIVPLAFALMLNEVRRVRLKKAVQTIVYLPHFLSWVILASVMTNIFGYDGIG